MDEQHRSLHTRAALLAASSEDRAAKCGEIASLLTAELDRSDNFHLSVGSLVEHLRLAGYDLWSYDERDDTEIWGPSYMAPSAPGIVVTFSLEHGVSVEWDEP